MVEITLQILGQKARPGLPIVKNVYECSGCKYVFEEEDTIKVEKRPKCNGKVKDEANNT